MTTRKKNKIMKNELNWTEEVWNDYIVVFGCFVSTVFRLSLRMDDVLKMKMIIVFCFKYENQRERDLFHNWYNDVHWHFFVCHKIIIIAFCSKSPCIEEIERKIFIFL